MTVYDLNPELLKGYCLSIWSKKELLTWYNTHTDITGQGQKIYYSYSTKVFYVGTTKKTLTACTGRSIKICSFNNNAVIILASTV